MQHQRKLLMSFMVWALLLFYGITATTALASEKVAEIALGSTVHVDIIDDVQDILHIGSGFFVGPNQVATNYHVIEELLIAEAKLVGRAKLVGEEEIYIIEAIVAHDKEWDLAVVKVKGVQGAEINVPALPLGDSDSVKIGETIYVAGNPQGLEGTFTKGIISGRRPEGTPLVHGEVLQMDAPISPGSSGGPVLDEIGRVIGISVGSRIDGQNLNFAIPVNYLKAIMGNTRTVVKPKRTKPKVDSPSIGPPPTETKLALTPYEIASGEIKKIANSSVVLLVIEDVHGNSGYGSGFVLGVNQIATNHHVIDKMATGKVKLTDKEKWYDIRWILAFDRKHDLAIVEVKGIDAPALTLGNSDTVKRGDTIYVAGNPSGPKNKPMLGSVLLGTIRKILTENIPFKDRSLRGTKFRIDASTEPGSSGGPVLNDNGEVIGISVGGYTGADTDLYIPQGHNYAIAVNHLKDLAKRAGIRIIEPRPITPTPPKIAPIVKHAPPSKISVGEIIPLTVNVDSTTRPRQVTIRYRETNGLGESSQGMLGSQQSALSPWVYKANLPPQRHVGLIEYYIEVEYDQAVFRYPSDQNRYYQISLVDDKPVDDKPPTISLLYPPNGAKFSPNQEIIFRAKVTDDTAVEDVHLRIFPQFNEPQSYKLTAVGSPNIYTVDMKFANMMSLPYHLTAIDEEGNEGRSETRHLEIETIKSPSVTEIDRGINLYKDARYSEAIEVLSRAIREIRDSEPRAAERRAEAYLYLGGATRGAGESRDKVRGYFEEAIRHNPNQELPPWLGKDHPIFAELIEEVRNESTGELTVISLRPETEIWISSIGTERKLLGTGIVTRRLSTGRYSVEGIYEGNSEKRVVTIEPNGYKRIDLGISPIVEHDFSPRMSIGAGYPPLRISVDEIIPLTLDLISTKSPQQVTIYYTTYDRDRNELGQSYHEMRLWAERPAPSMWVYRVDLPPQKQVGSIEYYIEIEYEDHGVFEYGVDQNYQIFIVDERPPTISLLGPPDGTEVERDGEVTIRAEVSASVPIGAAHVHFSSSDSQEMSQENYSDVYTTNIQVSESFSYYLTAIDEAGNRSVSESRRIGVIKVEEPEPKEGEGEGTSESGGSGTEPRPFPLPIPEEAKPSVHAGVWAGAAANIASTSNDWNMFRLAYLREGRLHTTLGVQLDVSYPDLGTNLSGMVQWEPVVKDSKVGFTLLGGVAAYEDSPGSTHTPPLFGAGLQFYPRDDIVIDATGSAQFLPGSNTVDLYHYEVGIRFYVTPGLGLRAGCGRLYLGDEAVTTVHVGLGVTF